jgi:UDP-N-acetylmuramyl pentapeptide phosphotransferase/UDP-N-acetylglucosamine-1-phosphate transferase
MRGLISSWQHGIMAGLAIIAAAAAICAFLIVWLMPLLQKYALARPNARSSHTVATPQGGGIAVVGATLAVWLIAVSLLVTPTLPSLVPIVLATVLLAALGAIDDLRTVAVAPRLFIQVLAVTMVIASLPADAALLPLLPWSLERALWLLAGVWFVNLVNFMDGLDWMTVAEIVPLSAALIVLSLLDALPVHGAVLALALLGAMLGFAPFNKPVARLFLGDVGSLPVGLLLGYLLALLALGGHLAAALLLPLYYLADATLTLLRRLSNGERIWQAHRSHFYQRATDNGWRVPQIVGSVFGLNIVLAALALASVWQPDRTVQGLALLFGATLVGGLLTAFSRKRT